MSSPLQYPPPLQPSFIESSIYQLRLVLQGISSLIWRWIFVRSALSLATLQATLQMVFGWSDVHLHCFRIHSKGYGSAPPVGPSFERDPRPVRLVSLGWYQRERLTYAYNFMEDDPPSSYLSTKCRFE